METVAEESYGAYDDLSLEGPIDRALDLLDGMMGGDLSPGEVRAALERLRPLGDVYSGGRDIGHLITVHETDLDENAYERLLARVEESYRRYERGNGRLARQPAGIAAQAE